MRVCRGNLAARQSTVGHSSRMAACWLLAAQSAVHRDVHTS